MVHSSGAHHRPKPVPAIARPPCIISHPENAVLHWPTFPKGDLTQLAVPGNNSCTVLAILTPWSATHSLLLHPLGDDDNNISHSLGYAPGLVLTVQAHTELMQTVA